MDNALYGLFGTLIGGIITGIGTWLTNRHQLGIRRLELNAERERRAQEAQQRARDEKVRCYATFLSANWQAERYVEEMIDAIERQRGKWIERVNGILRSQDYRDLIKTLNDSLGWIGVLCAEGRIEASALGVSDAYDQLMDSIDGAFALACEGARGDLAAARQELAALHEKLTRLSGDLRSDLHREVRAPASSQSR